MAAITEYEAEPDRAGERIGTHAGRVRPRPVAAADELGPLAHGLRGGGLRDALAGLARRSEHRRRGERASRGVREEDGRSDRRPLRRRHRELTKRPAVIGHSFGGLLTQILAGRGLSDASVAIDPAPFRGVLPLPISALKSASPVLGNPANHHRAVPLTYEQFRYAFANAVGEDEAQELYNTYAVPRLGRAALPGGDRELEPVDRGEGEVEEPRSRSVADHRRREGPHRAVGDRERFVQEAEAQQGRDRDREDGRAAGTRSSSTTAGARSPTPRSRSSSASSRP